MNHKRKQLEAWGFTVGERTLPVNTNYPGKFMVVEPHERSELPTRDGSNGPWAVVGDDLSALIELAFDFAADTYGQVPGQETADA
jgi:hypothetical protein